MSQNWQNEQQGAAANLGLFGGNPHPNPALHQFNQIGQQQANQQHIQIGQQQPLLQNGNENMQIDGEDNEDNGWPAWNPAIFAADNGHAIPQHPAQPQDLLELELSGSSMRFLRGDGPDISLDQVLDNANGDDSSSSSNVTSELADEHARFVAARNRCANVLIFGRKGLPSETFRRASGLQLDQPPMSMPNVITIPALSLLEPSASQSSSPAVTGLEIVPWKPILDVMALKFLPWVLNCR